MKELKRYDIELCGDCITFNAYGEGADGEGAPEGHGARVEAFWPDAGLAYWVFADLRADDGDAQEPHFGKGACGQCGETLAGHRWDAVAMLWVSETDWEQALEQFVTGYDECARWGGIWGDDGGDGEPGLIVDAYSYDWDEGAALEALGECADFLAAQWGGMVNAWRRATGSTVDVDWERMGHDFYLTRCGHGAGFWDRGYGEAGDRLTAAAKVYGDATYMLGDDRRIYA